VEFITEKPYKGKCGSCDSIGRIRIPKSMRYKPRVYWILCSSQYLVLNLGPFVLCSPLIDKFKAYFGEITSLSIDSSSRKETREERGKRRSFGLRLGYGIVRRPDHNGRLEIPEELRILADITGEISIVYRTPKNQEGIGFPYLEIWDREVYEKRAPYKGEVVFIPIPQTFP